MKALLYSFFILISIGFIDSYTFTSYDEYVNSLDQEIYEYIVIKLDDPIYEQIWNYYNSHRAECDSISLSRFN